jgi:hypothetical protein
MIWLPWIDAAAKGYAREFPDEPHNFSRAERLAAARQVAEHEAGRIQRGEYGEVPMAKAHHSKSKAKRRPVAPHERKYKPAAHHSTAHLPGPKARKASKAPKVRKAKHHRAKKYTTVTDTHRIPVAPSAATAVKALHGAIDGLEKLESELLTVRAALRVVRKPKTKKRVHPKGKTKKRVRF